MQSVEEFTADWRAMCQKIEVQRFDRDDCARQSRMMTDRLVTWKFTGGGESLCAADLLALESELTLALGIAFANYKRNGNWLTRTLERIQLKPKLIVNNNEWPEFKS